MFLSTRKPFNGKVLIHTLKIVYELIHQISFLGIIYISVRLEKQRYFLKTDNIASLLLREVTLPGETPWTAAGRLGPAPDSGSENKLTHHCTGAPINSPLAVTKGGGGRRRKLIQSVSALPSCQEEDSQILWTAATATR